MDLARGESQICPASTCLACGPRPCSTPSSPLACSASSGVGLGSVVEQLLGIRLSKAHSAADWSTRPLPHAPGSEYAALDVALLPDLRDAIAEQLDAQGKVDFAAQEFEAVRTRTPKPPADEPWRKALPQPATGCVRRAS